jgi:hypothetical protein
MARRDTGRPELTLGTINALVSQRLNEAFGAGGPQFYPTAEIVNAVNEGLRTFALLTLSLEKTVPWVVSANTTFFHMLTIFSDWIVPLRVADAAGAKIRPGRFSDLWALDATWPQSPGSVSRYVHAGADLVGLYKQPAAPVTLSVTYAYSPARLVNDGDVPPIRPEFHQELVKFAVYRMRRIEGGSEFAKALPLLGEFLAAASQYGSYVRARNKASGYDASPPELSFADISTLVRVVTML